MRGALFFSLKDNVSYEETGTKYKRDREYAGLWVSGDSFCRFTAVYAEQAGDDRKCKIFVFPEYYAGAGGFCGAGCAVAEDPGRTDNETDVGKRMCLCCCIWCLQSFLSITTDNRTHNAFFIDFVIPFASLKAQTSYEKCCAPPLFDL